MVIEFCSKFQDTDPGQSNIQVYSAVNEWIHVSRHWTARDKAQPLRFQVVTPDGRTRLEVALRLQILMETIAECLLQRTKAHMEAKVLRL